MLTLTIHGLGGWFSIAILTTTVVAAPIATYRMGKDEGAWQAKVRAWDEEDA